MGAKAPAKANEATGPAKAGLAKAGRGRKKLLIVALALLLLGGGAAGAWASGAAAKLLGKGEEAAEAGHGAAPKPAGGHGGAHGAKAEKSGADKPGPDKSSAGPLFMDLPDIVANLNAGPRRTSFVKLKVKLELSRAEDQAAIQAALPRVLDLFQGYLREVRPEELRGSASTYRLREELLARTNLAAPPARAVAVLFTEMIVQ